MKMVSVKLTQAQANFIANTLEENYMQTYEAESNFAFDKRIIAKIRTAIAEAK